jgi:hypothetical protein
MKGVEKQKSRKPPKGGVYGQLAPPLVLCSCFTIIENRGKTSNVFFVIILRIREMLSFKKGFNQESALEPWIPDRILRG